jgi:hypothetical protein
MHGRPPPPVWRVRASPGSIGGGGHEQFSLSPGQTLQVIVLPGRIELVPTTSPAELLGFLQGRNTFQQEDDRL